MYKVSVIGQISLLFNITQYDTIKANSLVSFSQ